MNFLDVSMWLALTAIILLVTAEIISPRLGEVNLVIDKKKLRKACLIAGLSLVAIALRICEMLGMS